MQYLMLVCTDPEAEPYDPALDRIGDWVNEYGRKGWRLDGERLRPSEDAVTVRVRRGQMLATDGPFADTKEGIAGYDLLDCPDLDAAIEVASKHPMARFGRLELRPVNPLGLRGLPKLPPAPVGSSLFFQFIVDEPGAEPFDPAQDNIEAWVAEHLASGVLRGGDRLAGVESATTVRWRGGKLLVTDGPFAETKETLAGYGILACRSLDEAARISAGHPMARFGCIEVRAFWPFG